MQRVPEPELMDEATQAEAYALADFAQAHQGFVDFFETQFAAPAPGARVLDLGCGPADVTIRFARRYPAVRIVGIDGAQAMLEFARRFVEEQGLDQRIELRRELLQELGATTPGYDVIISNSLLHHLHEPALLWQAIKANAGAGASICIMDLYRPDNMQAVQQLVDAYAAEAPAVLRRDFHNSLCAAFTPAEVRAQLREHGLDYLQVRTISDRHLVVFGHARR